MDIKALKAKLNTLKGQNSKSTAIWKPKPGKNTIRIVPWKENKENPFVELYFHYLGGKTYLSPTSWGRPDPIAEFSDKLRTTGDKEDYQQSKAFKPKARYYVPVVVRGEENEGTRFYAFGKQAYEAFLAISTDEEFGEVEDPRNGRDMIVEFTPQEESDTNFAKTQIRPRANASALADSDELINKLLTEQPDIREIYKEPTYAELELALENYLNPDGETPAPVTTSAPSTDEAEEKPAETSQQKSKKLDTATKNKLDKLFDED